jgi:transcriptional regulator with XRE-family HTH domain
MALAETLRQYRKQRGLTQQELADLAGLTQGAVTNLERGVNPRPSGETVKKLAHALGITADQLMVEADLIPPPATLAELDGAPDLALQELIRAWPDLTPEDRETALAVTRSLLERHQKRKKRKNGAIAPESNTAAS